MEGELRHQYDRRVLTCNVSGPEGRKPVMDVAYEAMRRAADNYQQATGRKLGAISEVVQADAYGPTVRVTLTAVEMEADDE